jgi:hypothetical protein
MSDPFWAYLERLPGKSAALFDWDKALSGWDRYPLFRDHFLQLTKNHAIFQDHSPTWFSPPFPQAGRCKLSCQPIT